MRTFCETLPLLMGLAVAAGATACQSDTRPPFASDGHDDPPGNGGDAEAPSTLISDEDDDGVGTGCGGTTIELEIQRPNFYFVLDSSESMLETMPNSGGISRHLGARQAIGDMLRRVGRRVNFGAATFPRQGGCTPGGEVYTVRPGQPWQTDAGDGPALEGLLFTLRKEHPDGATPTSQTLRELQPILQELPGRTSVFLLTDGAPNCDVDEPCEPNRCIPDIERLPLSDGQICGESIHCCAPDLAPHLCLDDDDTEQALAELANAGIKTYIIGIPGSETYAQVLNRMAIAAQTQNDGATAYYPVNDAAQLALTLSELGDGLSLNCSFELDAEPGQPSQVRVYLDDDPIELDGANGYSWASPTAVELHGKACKRWKSGDIEQVQVLESCRVKMR